MKDHDTQQNHKIFTVNQKGKVPTKHKAIARISVGEGFEVDPTVVFAANEAWAVLEPF